MRKILLALMLFPTLALAEPKGFPFVPSCIIQDSIGIRDEGEGRAVVTYYNSIESCSSEIDIVLVSQNDVAVRVIVTIGDSKNENRETIQIIPLDSGWIAIPPEGHQLDGETAEYLVEIGLS